MKILIFSVLTLFLFSCSSKFSLQKRKYNRGYYLGIASKKNKPVPQTLTVNDYIGNEVIRKKSELENKKENSMSIPEKPDLKQHVKAEKIINIFTANATKKRTLSLIANSKSIKELNHYQTLPAHPQKYNTTPPFDTFGSGMGIFSVFGIISGIVSFIVLIIYLLFLFSTIGLFTSFINALWIVGLLILVAIIIGLVVLSNSD